MNLLSALTRVNDSFNDHKVRYLLVGGCSSLPYSVAKTITAEIPEFTGLI